MLFVMVIIILVVVRDQIPLYAEEWYPQSP